MANDRQVDCLIIGQGLAGSCLAFELLRRNKSIVVIDRDAGKRCSAVAAGTVNPVSFRTHSQVWMADILVPYLQIFYREWGEVLGRKLFTERPIYRRFRNEDQKHAWKDGLKKASDMHLFMEDQFLEELPGVQRGFGFGVVKNSGTLHIQEMLSTFREYLRNKACLIEEQLKEEELEITHNGVGYKNLKAQILIYCTGSEVNTSGPFGELPFRKTKGEVLIIEAPGLKTEGIVHDGINIVPLANELLWVGSTFNWNDDSTFPTPAVQIELESKIKQVLDIPYKIVEHIAGIRPTVKDRRPIIGTHPEYKSLAIFNGMGTRGVMLAPYFAGQLADYLFENGKIFSEVDVRRFLNPKATS